MRILSAFILGTALLLGHAHGGDTSSFLGQALRINGINFRIENDLYGWGGSTTDQHYTNGFQVLFPLRRDPDRDPTLRPWVGPFTKRNYSVSDGYLVSQTMYSPKNIRTADPLAGDRPYGGLLTMGKYQSILIHPGNRSEEASVSKDGDRDKKRNLLAGLVNTQQADGRLTYKFMVGWLGEASFAEETQTWVHENLTTSAPKPEGWHHQVPGEPVLQFNSRLEWELADWDGFRESTVFQDRYLRWADVIAGAGTDLGNAYSNVNLGLMVRGGLFMQSYFTGGTENVITKDPSAGPFMNWLFNSQLYLFAESRTFLVARNALIHCGVHDCEVKQDIRPFVFDVETGMRGSIPFLCNLELSGAYLFAWRSMEHQADPWELFAHKFGSWQVGVVYRPK